MQELDMEATPEHDAVIGLIDGLRPIMRLHQLGPRTNNPLAEVRKGSGQGAGLLRDIAEGDTPGSTKSAPPDLGDHGRVSQGHDRSSQVHRHL